MRLLSAFESWCKKCEILEKYFPYLWAFLQRLMSAFLKIPVFLGWVLRILWSKVTNNDVSKIRVFLCVEMFKFHVVGELSCWGLELE